MKPPRKEVRTVEFRQTLTMTIVLMVFVASTWLVNIEKLNPDGWWQAWSNVLFICIGWFGARQAQRRGDGK